MKRNQERLWVDTRSELIIVYWVKINDINSTDSIYSTVRKKHQRNRLFWPNQNTHNAAYIVTVSNHFYGIYRYHMQNISTYARKQKCDVLCRVFFVLLHSNTYVREDFTDDLPIIQQSTPFTQNFAWEQKKANGPKKQRVLTTFLMLTHRHTCTFVLNLHRIFAAYFACASVSSF